MIISKRIWGNSKFNWRVGNKYSESKYYLQKGSDQTVNTNMQSFVEFQFEIQEHLPLKTFLMKHSMSIGTITH